MSVIVVSAVTEVIVLSAITLTLINAFSHGALKRLVTGKKAEPVEEKAVEEEAVEYRLAA